jgi:hypothetical protein
VRLRLALAAAGLIVTSACTTIFPPSEPSHPILELADATVGVPYRLDISTHCGFRGTSINGDPWIPVEGSVPREGNVFGFNFTRGTVTLTDQDHAVYVTETNFTIQLERVHGPPPSLPACF